MLTLLGGGCRISYSCSLGHWADGWLTRAASRRVDGRGPGADGQLQRFYQQLGPPPPVNSQQHGSRSHPPPRRSRYPGNLVSCSSSAAAFLLPVDLTAPLLRPNCFSPPVLTDCSSPPVLTDCSSPFSCPLRSACTCPGALLWCSSLAPPLFAVRRFSRRVRFQ